MDQSSLSLNFLKEKKKKEKNRSIRLKKEREEKWNKQRDPFQKGQTLLEALFSIIFIVTFLISIQTFQSLARKEIQKERLVKSKWKGLKKAPWLKQTTEDK